MSPKSQTHLADMSCASPHNFPASWSLITSCGHEINYKGPCVNRPLPLQPLFSAEYKRKKPYRDDIRIFLPLLPKLFYLLCQPGSASQDDSQEQTCQSHNTGNVMLCQSLRKLKAHSGKFGVWEEGWKTKELVIRLIWNWSPTNELLKCLHVDWNIESQTCDLDFWPCVTLKQFTPAWLSPVDNWQSIDSPQC